MVNVLVIKLRVVKNNNVKIKSGKNSKWSILKVTSGPNYNWLTLKEVNNKCDENDKSSI